MFSFIKDYNMSNKMKVVCAWCKKVIKQGDAYPVSHGICEDCIRVLLRKTLCDPDDLSLIDDEFRKDK